MKNLILALIASSGVLFSCNNSNSSSSESSSADSIESRENNKVKTALISFEETKYDFGTVTEGEKVVHEYKFTNKGKEPLIISDASASCGCTVPEFPKKPIPPGQSGVIKVVFDSAERVGKQSKVVTVTSNDYYATTEVYLTGEVKAKEK